LREADIEEQSKDLKKRIMKLENQEIEHNKSVSDLEERQKEFEKTNQSFQAQKLEVEGKKSNSKNSHVHQNFLFLLRKTYICPGMFGRIK